MAQFSLDWNPEKLLAELQRRGINHRIVRDEQRQSLWIEQPEHIVEVDQLVRKVQEPERRAAQDPWRYGSATPLRRQSHNVDIKKLASQAGNLFRQFPVVMWAITFSLAGALLDARFDHLVSFFYFPTTEEWSLSTIWRWLTPIFLHFGISHVVFNCLWLWVFGSRLEHVLGSAKLLLLITLTGLGGNIAQYLWSQSVSFGGMSGVVFGLMGYLCVRQKLKPHPLLNLPPMLYGIMFIFLVLGITGTLWQLFGSAIANGAHLGGLLTGMALALMSSPAPKR
ncbi:rhomboid family intramembrane serine protease [Porticoccus sp. W117]|uniref:rhomboid family intramembrane serine protease n=1 Tax=Porticoccus sp. W117 TaxID=3054777 RepID=UPI00259488E6|nr:rhomboid family intramembrane serine protease [Porticoccus sp. W117]MDM3870314.1 rhomboid family intramembrane serine protease [Porticoccus sp. W117]